MSSRVVKSTVKSNRGKVEDAKSRRERGNLAQRAFRQKQIDTIRNLKEENQRFRDAIAAVSKAATENKSALVRAIKDAQAVADVGEDLDIIDLPQSPVPEVQESVQADVVTERLLQDERQHATTSLVPNTSMQDDCFMMDFLPSPHPDRHLRLTAAPLDIVPYTGAAAYTVAGQIHWVAIAYSYSAVKELRNSNNNNSGVTAALSSSSSSPAYRHAIKVFGQALGKISLDELLHVVHGRLMYRKYGFMAGGEHPGRDPWAAKTLMNSIIDQCAPVPREFCLSAFGVTEKLRLELGADDYDHFAATVAGLADASRIEIMRALMKDLAARAICFGDGPRWHPEDVVLIAQRWTLETIVLAR